MRYEGFIYSLIETSNAVRAAYQEVSCEWKPEDPPVTTLFAALGDQIVEDFGSTDLATNNRIFFLIEQGMESDDEGLVTAVATGLIEALATKAVSEEDLWNRISKFLGPKSLQHANAWLGK
ncbi:hypothetical protein N8I74_00430 [Chitiniphilus purpureus]|uniref:DUF7674 domain-containing protein n=1 Tax=Chitiniphilus purpureus TaxID=2981137 RepID=A0ABY6DR05_9NEIS|nr:hypothetical protein [Chitiniphilus sp. CD1]UXY15516.1 hypothetical protein N8I74_00430 [Chitiniphilus sp. CD1]